MSRTHPWLAWLAIVLLFPSAALAEATLTLGLLAYLPKEEMMARYQPLADYLSRQVPGTRVVLRPLAYENNEIETALANHELDFLLTNPSHFIQLRRSNALTGAIVTQQVFDNGQVTMALGGVIFTRVDHVDIHTLSDILDRRIAAADQRSLGAYQAQVFELHEAGLATPGDIRFLIKHDKVVDAVMSGDAEVGFVRTGVLENMARRGRLDMDRIRIIHPRVLPGFPFAISTLAYPEWPFIALPHTETRVVRRIAAALLSLEPGHPAADAAGLAGFAPPADYQPVENLLRALRLPPFEGTPSFTLGDIWARYQATLVSVLAGGMLVLFLGIRLFLGHRRLQQAQSALRESEARLCALLDNTPSLMWLKDANSRYLAANRPFLDFAGLTSPVDAVGKSDLDLWPREAAERYMTSDREVMESGCQSLNEQEENIHGRRYWMEVFKTPVRADDGHILGTVGFARDISERREREQRRLAEEIAHRDTLVREVHHRIKNNLQSVAALLRRELGKHAELDPRLEAAITQVYAIAVVHGLQSADPSETTLLCDTIDQICRTVRAQTQRAIAWLPDDEKTRFGDIQIARDEAVAIALVINELLLNAVKHSPPEGTPPIVHVRNEIGGIRITIENPVAVPPQFDFASGEGTNTGLRLVRSLLPEDGAKLTFDMDAGGCLSANLVLRPPAIKMRIPTDDQAARSR